MEKLNISNIRNLLWEEIHKLRKGETSAAAVNAITNANGKILTTVKLQMEYAKMTGGPLNLQLLEEKG